MNNELDKERACDPTLSRSQFIKMLVERATVAGALIAAPVIVDSFIAPQAVAAASGGQVATALSFKPLA